MKIPKREDCIHHPVCNYGDFMCPCDCGYFEEMSEEKSVIQQYYDLETNGEIHWIWDAGFDVYFNYQPEGYKEHYFVETWDEVENIFKEKLNESNN